jgi:hypothetical protein
MNKLRYAFATIALVAALGGSILLQGAGSAANAASSYHAGSVSSALVVGKSTDSGAKRYGQCPGSVSTDC